MTAKFSVHYIRSTQKEIAKKRAKGEAMIADGQALLDQANSLETILGDQSVNTDVIVQSAPAAAAPQPVFQEE